MILTCQECGEFVEQGDAHCSECGCEVVSESIGSKCTDTVVEEETGNSLMKVDLVETSIDILDCAATFIEDLPPEKEEPPSVIDSTVTTTSILDPSDSNSECTHFSLEFNEGSSVFSVGYGSSFQFKLIPSCQEALDAENVEVKVSRDASKIVSRKFRVIPRRLRPISVYMNCTPESGNEGADICMDVTLSYFINGRFFSYVEHIIVDVYAENIETSKMIENLHVRIDNINQEGAQHAGDQGDQKVCLIDSIGKGHDRNEIMTKLKQADLWRVLPLYRYISSNDSCLVVPPIPLKLKKGMNFKLTSSSGETLFLHQNRMTLGRSRDCSFCTRNMPPKGEQWSQTVLRERNLKISGEHCSVEIVDGKFIVMDRNSANGTYIDGVAVSKRGKILPSNKSSALSLAQQSMAPNNFELILKVLDGLEQNCSCFDVNMACIVTARAKNNESHVIMNGVVSLKSLSPGFSSSLYLVNKGGCWAITDLEKWTWLDKDGDVGGVTFTQV